MKPYDELAQIGRELPYWDPDFPCPNPEWEKSLARASAIIEVLHLGEPINYLPANELEYDFWGHWAWEMGSGNCQRE